MDLLTVNVLWPCVDCVSLCTCVYRAAKLTCASVYGMGVCKDA